MPEPMRSPWALDGIVTPVLFRFEADIALSLRRFPMSLRYKMDTCGVHVSLQTWQRLSFETRQSLFAMPADTREAMGQFVAELERVVANETGLDNGVSTIAADDAAHSLVKTMPEDVASQIVRQGLVGFEVAAFPWNQLTALERFALVKLSRPGHRNRGFDLLLAEIAERVLLTIAPRADA